MVCNLSVQCVSKQKKILCHAELDAGFQGYGYPADGMDGMMMQDDYPGSLAYERQAYS